MCGSASALCGFGPVKAVGPGTRTTPGQRLLFDFAAKHLYASENPSEAERMAIIATGGYGRGLMAPGSDIDLLFVLPYKQTAWGESVAEVILYCLWDLGLKVGHATRSIKSSSSRTR